MATWFGGFHNQVVWVFVHHGEIRIIDLWDSVTKAVTGLTSFERQHISKSSGKCVLLWLWRHSLILQITGGAAVNVNRASLELTGWQASYMFHIRGKWLSRVMASNPVLRGAATQVERNT